MVDPVLASDGHTYERGAITVWLLKSNISPVTGARLTNNNLLPNITLRCLILRFLSIIDPNRKPAVFDQAGWYQPSLSGYVPFGRSYSYSAVSGGNLYVFGGMSGSFSE